ncbi:HEPN domain-containing protein [Candidatus Peregrinibacteria bacterium]|nr:HEPN domain-containing protein [Candidatus Peregrinibacteria bacterium]
MTNQKLQFLEWAKRAEDDLQMAELALKENGQPSQICFHSQQTAEKYLKSQILVPSAGIEPALSS